MFKGILKISGWTTHTFSTSGGARGTKYLVSSLLFIWRMWWIIQHPFECYKIFIVHIPSLEEKGKNAPIYLWLYVIICYLLLVLVVLQLFINFGCTCNYIATIFFFIVPCGQCLITFSSKNNPIWPISCNNDQNKLHHCGVGLNPRSINFRM